jgi:hypothetical protein
VRYTEYHCDNTLFIYGNQLFAQSVCNVAAAIFGRAESSGPLFKDASPDKTTKLPLIVFAETTTPQLPPVCLVAEVSQRVPELTFYLAYDHRDVGCNGGLHFKAGTLTGEWHDHYGSRKRKHFRSQRAARATTMALKGGQTSDSGDPLLQPEDPFVTWLLNRARLYGLPVHAMPDESGRAPVSSLPSLRAVAEELLARALSPGASEPVVADDPRTHDRGSLNLDEDWAAYGHVKALLTGADTKELEAREAGYLELQGEHAV